MQKYFESRKEKVTTETEVRKKAEAKREERKTINKIQNVNYKSLTPWVGRVIFLILTLVALIRVHGVMIGNA